MITWNRLLIGRLRDATVGRDVLVGAAAGVALALVQLVARLLGTTSGAVSGANLPRLSPLVGTRFVMNSLLTIGFSALFNVLLLFFILFLFRLALRRDWLMAAAFVALTVVQGSLRGAAFLDIAAGAAVAAMMVTVILRLGFVAFCVAIIVNSLLTLYPLSTDLGAWYGTPTLFAGAVLAVVAFGAFRIALGGKPLLGGAPGD